MTTCSKHSLLATLLAIEVFANETIPRGRVEHYLTIWPDMGRCHAINVLANSLITHRLDVRDITRFAENYDRIAYSALAQRHPFQHALVEAVCA